MSEELDSQAGAGASPSPPRTVTARREAVLAKMETGSNVSEAAKDTGIGRSTVYAWLTESRREDASPELVDWRERYEAIRQRDNPTRLTKPDVIRLLEKRAVSGSVEAAKTLIALIRQEEKDAEKETVKEAPDEFSEFVTKRHLRAV